MAYQEDRPNDNSREEDPGVNQDLNQVEPGEGTPVSRGLEVRGLKSPG